MLTYDQIVQQTLDFTGTRAEDWAACPFDDTLAQVVPQWPVIATPFSGQAECCHLCGHKIKHEYLIMNPAVEKLMVVGSDCVRHFGPQTGEELLKEAEESAAFKAMEWVVQTYDRELNQCLGGGWPAWAQRYHGGRIRWWDHARKVARVATVSKWTRPGVRWATTVAHSKTRGNLSFLEHGDGGSLIVTQPLPAEVLIVLKRSLQ